MSTARMTHLRVGLRGAMCHELVDSDQFGQRSEGLLLKATVDLLLIDARTRIHAARINRGFVVAVSEISVGRVVRPESCLSNQCRSTVNIVVLRLV